MPYHFEEGNLVSDGQEIAETLTLTTKEMERVLNALRTPHILMGVDIVLLEKALEAAKKHGRAELMIKVRHDL